MNVEINPSEYKVLIVDDVISNVLLLKVLLTNEKFNIVTAGNGTQALEQVKKEKPDLVLLDVMMPGKDGYEVCRPIRQESAVPIILITARGEDYDKIMGLDIGADDYIVKPFSPSEVMARLRAVLRRISRQSVETQSGQILRVSNMEVNLDEYTFCIDGKKIPMTKKEIETMWTLASTPGKVYTRDNLLDSLWGYDYYGDSRTVDSHIKRLRAKLDSVPHPDWTIKTIWGVGYKLEIAGGQ